MILCPMYTCVFSAVGVTAQQDFFEVKASANSILVVHGWSLTQGTETGDAAEEMLQLSTNRGTGSVTSGSGGSSGTINPIMRGAPSFGGAIEINNTTKLAVGTGTLTTDLEKYNWNIRVPMTMIYTPEMRPIILPSDYWTLELETTPADSVTISGTVWVEQKGV